MWVGLRLGRRGEIVFAIAEGAAFVLQPHLSPTLSVEERGPYRFSVENALLTDGIQPHPNLPPCRGKEQIKARLKY
jgi:hypothetical protein